MAACMESDVESSLREVVRKHVGLIATGVGNVIRKRAVEAISLIETALRQSLASSPQTYGFCSKFDLGYAAMHIAGKYDFAPGSLESEIVSCLTYPLHTIQGPQVPLLVVRQILSAASTTATDVKKTAEAEEQELSKAAAKMYCRRPKAKMQSDEPEASTRKMFESVHVISSRSVRYDPLFPESAGSSKGPGVRSLPPNAATVKKRFMSGEIKTARDDGQQKLTTMFNPVPQVGGGTLVPALAMEAETTEDTGEPASSSSFSESPASSSESPPKKVRRCYDSASVTPEKELAPPQHAQGNFGHVAAVPWHEDELDFVAGLIVIYRDSLTWQQLADASNAYFKDKPIVKTIKEEGIQKLVVIRRGDRTPQAVRQHPFFRSYASWWERLEAQEDVGGPGTIVDWKQANVELPMQEEGVGGSLTYDSESGDVLPATRVITDAAETGDGDVGMADEDNTVTGVAAASVPEEYT